MKRRPSLLFAAVALALGTGGALADDLDTPVEVNVEHLQPRLAADVERHAAEGYKSLARFMERTRFVHRLWFDDVVRPKRDTAPLDRTVAARDYRKHAIEWR